MDLINRYVMRDTLIMFFVAIVVTISLMTLFGGVQEGLRNNLPPDVIARVMPYLVPETLRFVTPACLLIGVCGVFGRMAASNEIVALKSLGINPLSVIWPTLLVSFVLSLFTFWMYEVCAVWSRPNVRRIAVESIERVAYSVLRGSKAFRANGMSIVVRDVVDRTLVQATITVDRRGDTPPVALTADRVQLRADPEEGVLRIECYHGSIETPEQGQFVFPHEFVFGLPAQRIGGPDGLLPAALATRAIPGQIEREIQAVAELEQRLSAPPAGRNPPAIENDLDHHRLRLFRLQAEVPRRLANGLACTCFALIGIPAAIWWRSANLLSTFFLCFLPILLVYYPLLITGETLAKNGFVPELSVWIANGVLMAAGGYLLWRITRRGM
jgi:lipopolysaccharide export system permease protein